MSLQIYNYHTDEPVFETKFETHLEAIKYWAEYNKEETINTLIIIKPCK